MNSTGKNIKFLGLMIPILVACVCLIVFMYTWIDLTNEFLHRSTSSVLVEIINNHSAQWARSVIGNSDGATAAFQLAFAYRWPLLLYIAGAVVVGLLIRGFGEIVRCQTEMLEKYDEYNKKELRMLKEAIDSVGNNSEGDEIK
ncbi:MAG: hypothetical protein II399_04635 [Lachnospiraceae bacterium]|nr:hypothetical protein [Lachnospiraceae bacterium]